MITNYHHFELNGVKYRAAESDDGTHYIKTREPLRLQTGSVVQGESGKFQLRTDILEWRLSDWSGGEGQLVFDSEEANRYHISHNIDPLEDVGKLRLARAWEETTDELDATLGDCLQIARGLGSFYGMSPDANEVREWDLTNERWDTATANGDAGFGAGAWHEKGIVGDEVQLWMKEQDKDAIWKWNGTTFTEWTTSTGVTSGDASMAQLSSNIYFLDPGGGDEAVDEISKSGTPPITPTTILDLSESGIDGTGQRNILVAGNNRIYAVQRNSTSSIIWRITPSTAASTGFGEEILRQEGLAVETIWFHMGVLFMAGRVGVSGDSREQVIMYLRGSEVGVLANLRPGINTSGQIVATESQEFEEAYFLAQYGPGDGTYEWTLFKVNLISGAVAGTTVIDLQDTSNQPTMLAAFNGEQFFPTRGNDSTTYNETIRIKNDGTYIDTSAQTAYLDSSVNDFGVVDEKILLSVRLICEPLSANSSIEIQYQLDQDGTWISAGTYSDTGGSGTTFTISTAASAVTFRNLQLRILLSNGGTVTETPIVRSVSTRATVAAGVNIWDVALDLADDHGEAGAERKTGTAKMSNISTAADTESVVDFKDGYQDLEAGQFTSHDVVIDTYRIVAGRPGEGAAYVRLREVV